MSLHEVFMKDKVGTGYVRVPNEAGKWQDEILKAIYKRVPEASGCLIRVQYKNKDEEKGYAVGSAIISNKGSSKQATVPIVIKEFKLAPTDVFIADGAFLPFDEYTFKKHFSPKGVFSGSIHKREYDMAGAGNAATMYDQLHPPTHVKHASVMDEIIETINEKDLKEFKQSLTDNPMSFAAFDMNEKVASVVKTICTHRPSNLEKKASANYDVMSIEKHAFNKFSVMLNDSETFNPRHETWDFQMLKNAGISDDVINSGSFYKSAKKATPVLEQDIHDDVYFKPEKIVKPGTYTVKGENGVSYSGAVIPFMMSFDQKKIDSKLFIAGDKYAIQKDIVGVKKYDAVKLEEGNVEAGASGVFTFEHKGKVISTTPFTIESLSKNEENATLELWVHTPLGKRMKLSIVSGIEQIIPGSAKYTKEYLIPSDMKFVAIEKNVDLVSKENVFKSFEKVAQAGSAYVQVIDNDGTYTFKGQKLEKYAGVNGLNSDMTILRPQQAKFMLMSFGCDSEDVDGIMKTAGKLGHCKVYGLNFPETINESNNNGMVKEAKYKDLYAHIDDLKCNMVKEAGNLILAEDEQILPTLFFSNDKELVEKIAAKDQSQIVSDVLSLNFINKENVKKFVDMKDHLLLSSSKLAQLLVAARLGVKSIPEDSAATALHNLSYVIEGLDMLEGGK